MTIEEFADAPRHRLHMLDMGLEKYGDCLVGDFGGMRVLVDGGHRGDVRERDGYPSLPDQLEELLGPPPHEFDLLVVTHCHSDHIGCLPELVRDDVVRARHALVADDRMGFGEALNDAMAADVAALDGNLRRVIAALREEDRSDLPDDEVRTFLADAETLASRYRAMLRQLRNAGTNVVRYGRDDHGDLVREFSGIGMQVLGPSREHLLICAEAIARTVTDAVGRLRPLSDRSSRIDDVQLYRSSMRVAQDRAVADRGEGFSEDRPGKGAALNDQSIVLKFEINGRSLLLTGDMQFAKPEVRGLDTHMSTLRRAVADAGPYDFVKLGHHGSYNAVDEEVLGEYSGTRLLGISGGIRDAGHPDPGVLDLLSRHRAKLAWARTDRNGLVSLRLQRAGIEWTKKRGRWSDSTPNTGDVLVIPEAGAAGTAEAGSSEVEIREREPVSSAAPSMRQTFEAGSARWSDGLVEVLARIPHTSTRVTLTIDVDPGGRSRSPGREHDFEARRDPESRVGGRLNFFEGRPVPQLLFVTQSDRLRDNVGADVWNELSRAVATARRPLVDLPRAATRIQDVAPIVRRELNRGRFEGVVILGGQDVVPSERLDALTPALRRRISELSDDSDDFVIWSDNVYGDHVGDTLPDVPVSRVPDGRDAELFVRALSAPARPLGATRGGVRNHARPFADDVFRALPGRGDLLRSEQTTSRTVPETAVSADAIYFMLHGSERDGTHFWGERGEDFLEALSVDNVVDVPGSVVFTGCCYGALAVDPHAVDLRPRQTPQPRTADDSLALRYLKRGARAFIGCTGSHYSPIEPPFDYYGAPMHTAFWQGVIAGVPPARSLHEARLKYFQNIPHRIQSPTALAIERKILWQFTCLGLGW